MSESDTTDSDQGIRYKTENTRQVSTKYSIPEKDFSRSNAKFSSHKHSRKKFKRDESESSSDDEYYKRTYNNRRRQKHERLKSNDSVNKKDNSSISSESSSVSFGPALPPHLQQRLDNINVPLGPVLPPNLLQNSMECTLVPTETHSRKEDDSTTDTNIIGSDPSSNNINRITIGPALPPHLQQNVSENDKEIKNEYNFASSIIGPALPPHLMAKKETNNLVENLNDSNQIDSDKQPIIGPTLPHNLRQKLLEDSSCYDFNEEENAVVGPMPEGTILTKAHLELEERALQMRIDQMDPKEKEPTREEWMLELPAAKRAAFGLGPRSFKKKAGPDLSDRSSWTDTPQDKAKKKSEPKVDLKEEIRLQELHKRDKEQEELIKKHKKRKESLLDLHTKKMKTEKKDKEGPNERRPFSREIDLQVNRFDEAQKKAVLKKAQLLDNRFSSGEAKFL